MRTTPQHVRYSDNWQQGYEYVLTEASGRGFDAEFAPELTPKEMLKLGVFGGAYFQGVDGLIPEDLPKRWFDGVALSEDGEKHAEHNFYKIRASASREEWVKKGWIREEDPHGWFQWYCRYYLGRRLYEEDQRQIGRWKAFTRHVAQVRKNCRPRDLDCRPKQRQALLHWAYDSRKM
ncbi:MAG: hypothetical protein KC925_01495 [Candidatus Doudnabacteria bacterium]|nr:hypothetical protein [Candidatus Doudnabacteria bacterium]